jgi:hypothetical protein
MTWPIPPLATNRSNDTPQFDTHPADHNSIADGLNEIRARWYGQTRIVGYAKGPGTDQGNITGMTDATGYAVSFTAIAGHVYRAQAVLNLIGQTAQVNAGVSLADAANTILNQHTITLAVNLSYIAPIEWIGTFAAGARVVKVRLDNGNVGSGSVAVVGSFGRGGFIWVEDLGIPGTAY